MKSARSILTTTTLILVVFSLNGCIGFSGPNGIRNAIARSQDVRLDKEFGVDVGPLAIGFANLVAAPYLPMSLDGLSWVSVGQYTIRPHHDGSINTFSLNYLELNGWKTFVHVREEGSNIKLMCNTNGKRINKMLAIIQEGDELIIAKIEGDFEKLIDNIFDSELLRDKDFFKFDGNCEPPEEVPTEIADRAKFKRIVIYGF